MRTVLFAAGLLALVACAAPRPAANALTPQPVAAAAAPRPFRGGNAITQSETPYPQLMAQAQATGRPALLFFWTSW